MEQSMNIFCLQFIYILIFSLYFIIKPECHRDSAEPFLLSKQTNFLQNKRFSTF